jgi:hypothetical protein
MVISAVVLFITSAVARTAWDASMAGVEGRIRAQVVQAAASGAELHLAVLRRMIADQLIRNIREQGCRQQNEIGTVCLTEGNDTGRTSGIRRDRFESLAAASQQSWPDLQAAFVDVFRQVMPLAPEQDRYRSPATWGYAGLAIRGQLGDAEWFAYGIVAPIEGRPFEYNAGERRGTVTFEIRAYGWARAPLEGVQGNRTIFVQATGYSTLARLTMTYPACPAWWTLDSVCMYPQSVSLEIPESHIVQSDPAVTRRPW